MIKRTLQALYTTLFLTACTSIPGKGLPPLNGMIYDADNKPVPAAKVFLNGKIKATSDIQGHFTLSGLKPKKEYTLTLERKGYEKSAAVFTYSNATQVLYLRMNSGEQLVDEVETVISKKDWSRAITLLDRAEVAGCDTLASAYLRAVILAETGQYADAASLLENLRSTGESEPFIDLFLADLYQYRLALPDRASEALKRFLGSRSDSDVEKRLKALTE